MVSMMMERTGVAMPGLGGPGMGMGMGMPAPTMAGTNMLMVPRCTMKMEKMQGGMKMTCVCDDATAKSMLQNLCKMLSGSMCSCSMMMNGMVVCHCNLTMGMCKCDMTKDGCTITCTSGDKACEAMIQGCCECTAACLKAGCTCCVMMGGTPICCGC